MRTARGRSRRAPRRRSGFRSSRGRSPAQAHGSSDPRACRRDPRPGGRRRAPSGSRGRPIRAGGSSTSAFGVIRSRPDRPDPSAIRTPASGTACSASTDRTTWAPAAVVPSRATTAPSCLSTSSAVKLSLTTSMWRRISASGGDQRTARGHPPPRARFVGPSTANAGTGERHSEERRPSPANRPRPGSRVPRAPATRTGRTRAFHPGPDRLESNHDSSATRLPVTRRTPAARTSSAQPARPARSSVGSPPPFSTRLPDQTPAGPSRPSPSTEVCIRNAGPSASSAA